MPGTIPILAFGAGALFGLLIGAAIGIAYGLVVRWLGKKG
jgi:NhaP-type Na+/H+ or K+/H+ antiporter